MQQTTAACVLLALASTALLYKIFIRLRLSRAKHPSLLGHAKWSRRLARQVAARALGKQRVFTVQLNAGLKIFGWFAVAADAHAAGRDTSDSAAFFVQHFSSSKAGKTMACSFDKSAHR